MPRPLTTGDIDGLLVANGDRDGVNDGVNAGEVKLDSWLIGERGKLGNEVFIVLFLVEFACELPLLFV